jgi:hypothetical protein
MEHNDAAAAFIVASLAPSSLKFHIRYGDQADADLYFSSRSSISKSVALRVKAAVAAGTTTDGSWAGPLAPTSPEERAFVALADRSTRVTQLGR